jgi:hypothetical protein
MQQIKRVFSAVLAIAIIFSVLVFAPVTASAATDYEWETYSNSASTKFSVSLETGTFIIENTEYTESFINRRVDIESAGTYQVSVEVKIENFQTNPSDPSEWNKLIVGSITDGSLDSRASAGQNLPNNEWTTISDAFTATDNDSVNIYLFLATAKGKATFRNLKLEKLQRVEPASKEWNVLAVFFSETNVSIAQTGKPSQNINNQATSAQIRNAKERLNRLPSLFAEISGNRAEIGNIDIREITQPLRKSYGDNYIPVDNNETNHMTGVIFNYSDIATYISQYVESGEYDQVMVFFPLDDEYRSYGAYASENTFFNGTLTCFGYFPLSYDAPIGNNHFDDIIGTYIHELLHCVEAREYVQLGKPSRFVFDGTTVNLHSSEDYGYSHNGCYEWMSDFAQDKLPDRKGLPAEAFLTYRSTFQSVPLGDVTFAQNANVTLLDENLNPVIVEPEPDPEPDLDPEPEPKTAPNLDIASTWAHGYINEAYNKNLIPETLQDKYIENTTRAEFAALAVILYETVTGKVIEADVNRFTDTNDINAAKAAAIGVTTGTGDGSTFSPNVLLNREQAATMLSRLANAVGQPLPEHTATFVDNEQVSSWAVEAVGQMQTTNIMGGVGGNRFAPGDPYTREQSIVTILRLFNIVS